jgi:hypothetical protein
MLQPDPFVLRRGSATHLRWCDQEITAENKTAAGVFGGYVQDA